MWPFQAGAVIVEFLRAKEVRGRESCYQELARNYIEVDIICLWQGDGPRFVRKDLLDLIDSWFSHFLV
jgi:hypothetical protein